MECSICYTNEPTYVINCGSTVEHKVCDTCEVGMRMKEPATIKGRVLKCPMCRVYEKVPGKRSTFSYEQELSHLYKASIPVQRDWAAVAERVRHLPTLTREAYICVYPQLAPYFENYVPVHRLSVEAAIATAEGIASRTIPRVTPPAPRVTPPVRATPPARVTPPVRVTPPAPRVTPARVTPDARPRPCNAFCQSGRRETGECHTRSKTKRKCTRAGCVKFVCRSCRQCLTH